MPTESCYIKLAHDAPRQLKCGYEVDQALKSPETDLYYKPIHIHRMKQLFDKSSQGEQYRKELSEDMQTLRKDGIISDQLDIIVQYLTRFLEHCKGVMVQYGYNDNSTVEVSFGVPVCWTASANAAMENCMRQAMEKANFGIPTGNTTPKIFIANEAEASAIHALQSGLIGSCPGEIILLVDCGGGTADAVLFEVGNEYPLRMAALVTEPTGIPAGGCDLNDAMAKRALYDLYPEKHLCPVSNGYSFETLIREWIVAPFEEREKRHFKRQIDDHRFIFRIPGLNASSKNPRIKRNTYELSFDDMCTIFEPTLDKIRKLVENKIGEAVAKNHKVSKMVLVGGLGDSLALRNYLAVLTDRLNEDLNLSMEFVQPPGSPGATGVAEGALMRNRDRSHGPARDLWLSFGVSRTELRSALPEEARDQEWNISEYDGEEEVLDTIMWVLKKGQRPLDREHYVEFDSVHCFDIMSESWKAPEKLYVSETCTQDGFRLDHPKNEGKVIQYGTIISDLSCLKHLIPPTYDKRTKREYFRVQYRVLLVVVDRNTFPFVQYPAEEGTELLNDPRQGFSMAAAFQPGSE